MAKKILAEKANEAASKKEYLSRKTRSKKIVVDNLKEASKEG